MKTCKRITAVALLCCLFLGLSACAKVDQIKDAAAEESFSAGRVEGNTYTNEFLGISCALDESWTISSQEELAQQMGLVSKEFTDEDIAKQIENSNVAFLFMATQNDGAGNINITVSNSEAPATTPEDQKALIDDIAAQLPEIFALSSIEMVDCSAGNIHFCGDEYYGIYSHGDGHGIPVYQRQIYLFKDSYVITITMSAYNEDTTQELLGLFTSIEN